MIRRLTGAVAALAADVEDELQNMGELNRRWCAFGGVVVVAFFALLLGLNP
jgi:hypothetical protein